MNQSTSTTSPEGQEQIYPKPFEEMDMVDFDAFDEELSHALGKVIPSQPAEMPPVADIHAAYLQTMAQFFSIPAEYQSKSLDLELHYIGLMKIALHDLSRFKNKDLDAFHKLKGLNFPEERAKVIDEFKKFFLETFSKLKKEVVDSKNKPAARVKDIVKSVRKKVKKSF